MPSHGHSKETKRLVPPPTYCADGNPKKNQKDETSNLKLLLFASHPYLAPQNLHSPVIDHMEHIL